MASIPLYICFTLQGIAKLLVLAKALFGNRCPDAEWSMDKHLLELSLVARLGGHSAVQTHRGWQCFGPYAIVREQSCRP